MARHRWGGRASSRVRALGREGARVHAAAGARTVAPPEGFWLAGWCPTRAFASADLHSSARFRALPHPEKAGTVSATVVHPLFGQEPKADIHFEGPCDCILIRHIYTRRATA